MNDRNAETDESLKSPIVPSNENTAGAYHDPTSQSRLSKSANLVCVGWGGGCGRGLNFTDLWFKARGILRM